MTKLINPALVVIDAQVGINEEAHWGGNRNNRDAEKNIATLLEQWRRMMSPVIIVQHNSVSSTSPLRPQHSGNKLMDFVNRQPHEKLIQKSTACAFIQTDLQQYIEKQEITTLFITGFVTNNSVESTVRYAGDLGIKTVVVSDATACFDKLAMDGSKFTADVMHALSLANLKDEYATISSTEEVLQLFNRQSTIQNLRSV